MLVDIIYRICQNKIEVDGKWLNLFFRRKQQKPK